MYGIQIIENKKASIRYYILIALSIIIVILCIISAIKMAINYNAQIYARDLQNQLAKMQEEKKLEEEQKLTEELEKKQEEELSEEQMNNIKTIYSSEEKRVFLTFDDGPSQTVTPLILDLLNAENIKATFFVLGNRAKANPQIIQREYNEGHYIANHGYSHVYSQIYSTPQAVLDEYNYANKCIQEALGNENYNSKIFRFPGGSSGGYYAEIKNQAKELLESKRNSICRLE